MKFLSIAAASVIAMAHAAAASTFGPLVTPQELASSLDESSPVIIDIRGDLYAEGHLPGALSAPYGQFRGPKTNPGQILEARELESLYESLGLQLDEPIVIVYEGGSSSDFGAAARVYWTLKSTGFEDLTILNGGYRAWTAANLPTSKDPVIPVPSELDITFSQQWTVTTDEAAEKALDGSALLVDARTTEFFEGDKKHPAAARPGAAPGAVNYVFAKFFDSGSAAIQSRIDTDAVKEAIGLSEGDEVVAYCNTGHWAAINWFALSEVGGIDNVKLYPGSMVEYSQAGHRMMNTPGLFKNLKNQLLGDN
ncbi:MAG: rhodanese-like domain-containing protein [Rhodobacteraceae bacterium]|nr:rhodanese-like domain-containing protein [Paracoccaceae bacterium]MCY4327169.1 rhodanese-like domain-containing protein [Paracoccaceae bacterium]